MYLSGALSLLALTASIVSGSPAVLLKNAATIQVFRDYDTDSCFDQKASINVKFPLEIGECFNVPNAEAFTFTAPASYNSSCVFHAYMDEECNQDKGYFFYQPLKKYSGKCNRGNGLTASSFQFICS